MASIKGKKGVDISYANGNIDLSKVKKAGYDFVMIRCGYGSDIKSQDDVQFENNVKKAEALGMPWGVYLYSYATNKSEALSEVEHVKRLLKGKKPTLPIALDIEDKAHYTRNGCYNKTAITNIIKTFIDGIKKAGYYPMLYTGTYWLDNYIDKSVYGSVDMWIAQWSSACSYKGSNLGMWQYGGETNILESNSISGVGVIDKDKAYKDYPTIIKNGGYNGWSKTTTPTTPSVTPTVPAPIYITEEQLRQKVCNLINSWVGTVQGDRTHAEILNIYNSQKPLPVGYAMKTYDAWCAATVSAVWLKLGIAKYTGTECGCGRFIDVAKKLGIWVEADNYVPKLGDAVIYYWSDDGKGDCKSGADHIGIVTAVSGNKFTVTEGNMGSGVVGKRNLTVNARYIRGFIAPDYAMIAKKIPNLTPDTTTSNTNNNTSNVIDVTYRVKVGDKWLSAVKNLEDYAGIIGKPITDIAIKVSKGKVKYRVHIKGGKWLPYVTGYDINDFNNGYAGNGKPIDAIEIYYTTPSDIVQSKGYHKAKYRVSPVKKSYYSWQYDNEKDKNQDGYAGSFGTTIDRVQITISK